MPYCIVPDHHRHRDESSAENGGSGAAESGGNGDGNDGDGKKVRIFYETYGHGDTKVLMIMGLASGHAAWRYQVDALAGTGVPNGGGRQEGAEGRGEEKEEKGNDGGKERGEEEFGNGEGCWEESRDGKGGGKMEGEGGAERGVSEGCERERGMKESRGGEGRGEEERGVARGEEERGEEAKGEGERGEEEEGSSGRRSGIEVCVFDNRGVGHSSCPTDPSEYTTEVMAADALFLADHLGWTRFHLVGHSMGGMIACKVAAAASHRIISLALISVSGGGFDLLPRLDSRVFSIAYRLLNARTPESRAQVDLDTHFSQEYMEETDAGSGMSRREALHMEYVRELSAPSAMQTPHGANGHLNACWTHSLTPHDVDEICSAHIPTAVIHG
ncbi:unnamed protein product, partial [Closterium sp. Naga37s-1]